VLVQREVEGAWSVLSANSSVHRRSVDCPRGSEWCDEVTLLHIRHVAHWAYRVQLHVLAFPEVAQLRDCRFTFTVVNDQYTVFELWFRVVFLLVTAAWLVLFAHKMTGHRWGDWAVEQRWIGALLLALLAYNSTSSVTRVTR
jgi:hypothetical protein